MTAIPDPASRARIAGRAALEGELRAAIAAGAISHGWLIAGPEGAGKATLAYRMARAILDPEALAPGTTLDMPEDARTFRLIAARGHPDLFVAEPLFDEKTEKQASEITVETIRRLSEFLSKTAAAGGWRVAIIDAADDLNRNAANALLKSLEEPPAKTALLLIAHRPGRLLATIRSRCRRIVLPALAEEALTGLLGSEAGLSGERARLLAAAAGGRPGRALRLAAGEGAEAVELAKKFVETAAGGAPPGLSAQFGAKAGPEKWSVFTETVLDRLAEDARRCARAAAGADAARALLLAEAHAEILKIFRRGEALNMDRAQTLHDASRALARIGA